MGHVDVQENLSSGDVSGVLGWRIRARRSEQISAAENVIGVNWWPCQTAAAAGQPNLAEGDQERRLEARRLAILWSVSTSADCHCQFQSFICWFLEESGLWSARRSWQMMMLLWGRRRVMRHSAGSPASVSMVQQHEKTFRLHGQQLAVRRSRRSGSKRKDS